MCKALGDLGGLWGNLTAPSPGLGWTWVGLDWGTVGFLPAMSLQPRVQVPGEPMVLPCPLGCPRAAR